MNNKNKLMLAGIAGAIVMALIIGVAAFATTSIASAQTASTRQQGAGFAGNSAPGDGFNHRGGPGGMPGRGGENDTYLAEALGISVEDLQAAYTQAQEAALAQAVEQGLLTQEQADEMKASGRGFFGKGMRGAPGAENSIDFDTLLAEALGISVEKLQEARQQAQAAALQAAIESGELTQEQADLMQARQALKAYIQPEQYIADALGISVEDLQAAHQEHKSVSTLIEELGLNADEVQQAVQAAYEADVQQAVEDGVITQAQADQILSQEKGFGLEGRDGFGGKGGRGGPGAPGRGDCPNPPADPNSDGTDGTSAPGLTSPGTDL